MNTRARWTFFGAAVTLLACSGSGLDPGEGSGGAAAVSGGAAGNGASGGGGGGRASGGGAGSGTSGALSGSAAGASQTAGGSAGAGGAAGGGGSPSNEGGKGGGAAGGSQGGAGGASAVNFELSSPAFEHVEACTTADRAPCNFFPPANVFTNIGGMNQSPELNWGPGPSGTSSYVVCLHDTTANATHWCLWNIPVTTAQLPANLARQKMPAVPAGASQDGLGLGGSGEGYVGPGARGNVYQFRLYALSLATYAPPDAEDRRTVYADLERDSNPVVLATSTLRGRANPE